MFKLAVLLGVFLIAGVSSFPDIPVISTQGNIVKLFQSVASLANNTGSLKNVVDLVLKLLNIDADVNLVTGIIDNSIDISLHPDLTDVVHQVITVIQTIISGLDGNISGAVENLLDILNINILPLNILLPLVETSLRGIPITGSACAAINIPLLCNTEGDSDSNGLIDLVLKIVQEVLGLLSGKTELNTVVGSILQLLGENVDPKVIVDIINNGGNAGGNSELQKIVDSVLDILKSLVNGVQNGDIIGAVDSILKKLNLNLDLGLLSILLKGLIINNPVVGNTCPVAIPLICEENGLEEVINNLSETITSLSNFLSNKGTFDNLVKSILKLLGSDANTNDVVKAISNILNRKPAGPLEKIAKDVINVIKALLSGNSLGGIETILQITGSSLNPESVLNGIGGTGVLGAVAKLLQGLGCILSNVLQNGAINRCTILELLKI